MTHDQRMQRICTTLARAGYAVTLVGRQRAHSTPLPQFDFETHRLKMWFDGGKLFYLEMNLKLFFYLLFKKFDAVCAIDLDTILPSFWVGKIFRKKIIYDAHEYFTETPEVVRRPSIRWIWRAVARLTIPRIRHCYTVGEGLAQQFSERYRVDFQVIKNVPFSNTSFWEGKKHTPPVIFYQGALNEGRGLESAIEAMRELPEAQLWLAGEGDLSQKLRQRAADLGLSDRVRFLGWVAPDALREWTRGATVGINLLENQGLSYYFSLANKFFDYAQAKIPQVTMRFPEYERLCATHEVALLVENRGDGTVDTGGVIQAIKNLLENPDLYQKLVNNSEKAAKIWNWEQESERLIQIYKTVFEEK